MTTEVVIKNSTIRPLGVFLTQGGVVAAIPAGGELAASVDDVVLERLKSIAALGQLGLTIVSSSSAHQGSSVRAPKAGSTKKNDGSSLP